MCQFITFCHVRIGTFPLCAGIGLFCICVLVYLQLVNKKVKIETENKIMVCIPLSVILGILTAYASDILFRGGIKAFLSPFGYGVTFYGWLLGCIVFLFVYSQIVNIDSMFLLNLFLPTYSIAQAFGRIGCFLGGCCFGCPTKHFGVIYPQGSLPYKTFGDTPLFPVQLLESLYLFLLFVLLFGFVKFRKRAGLYLLLMPAGRFFFEYLRGDNRGVLLQTYLSPAQIFSLFFLLIGLILFIKSEKEQKILLGFQKKKEE
jgi:phosphatidylglycerol:prolipoprotein diacylglycerol transferase